MLGLGFGSGYIVHGSDVGSVVARILGAKFDECKAVHTTSVFIPPPESADFSILSPAELSDLARAKTFSETSFAYATLHATRPSTTGFLFANNPLGLLAWIGEKHLDWTDVKPTINNVLEQVTLYYFTNTIATSISYYRYIFLPEYSGSSPSLRLQKPLGFSSFPKELVRCPESWAKTTVSKETEFYFWDHTDGKGGHFPASENPEQLWSDLDEFCQKVWQT